MTDETTRLRDAHDILTEALDRALPMDGTVRRMHQRGRLAILIAEYGNAAAAEARAGLVSVEALVRDSAMAMESWHNIKAASGHGFHSGSWGGCEVPLCRRWVAALAATPPAPAVELEEPVA